MANNHVIRQEPNPTIVGRLMDFGVLRQGGREALQLAAQLARIARDHETDYPTDAVADYLRGQTLAVHVIDDPDDLVIAAGEVVDIVRAHDRQAAASESDDTASSLTSVTAPESDTYPHVDELLGADPGWTGGRSVDDYMADQRRESDTGEGR